MGVDTSPGGRNQPFYNVLGDDGSQRYAAHSKSNFQMKKKIVFLSIMSTRIQEQEYVASEGKSNYPCDYSHICVPLGLQIFTRYFLYLSKPELTAFVFVLAVNLREDPNQPFNPHPELGKYFKGFTGTRYIPNECLQQQYPEDVDEEEDA